MTHRLAAAAALVALAACAGSAGTAAPTPEPRLRFAVIGDFGWACDAQRDVAALVKGFEPELVITTGDDNYDHGEAATIDANVGQYWSSFIAPYRGSYGPGAEENAFFPSLGNHDWVAEGAAPYLAYFTLPGNERYYEFVRGPVHFFAVDSDGREPDGATRTSAQAAWLEARLAASTAPWKVVYFHHAPYSSGAMHGDSASMQWPFREWGASVVFSGHEHTYERIERDGLTYFVNGVGGRSLYAFAAPVEGSRARFSADYGAQVVDADAKVMTVRFYDRTGRLVDSVTLGAPAP